MNSSGLACVAIVSGALAACDGAVNIGNGGATGGGSTTGSAGGSAGSAIGGASTTGSTGDGSSSQASTGASSTGVTSSSAGGGPCDHGPNDDGDNDGWTGLEGDCNDCDPNVNPGAVEIVATVSSDGGVPLLADEDCDGAIDNVAPTCDGNLVYDDTDPTHAAQAIDLCKTTTVAGKTWGVIEAKYVRANGAPYQPPGLQTGIQAGFGPNVHVQGGQRLLALSSGHGRLPGQMGSCQDVSIYSCNSNFNGTPPAGFPQDVPGCAGTAVIHDDVGLELEIRAPSNAKGYSFDFDFYSYEYPEWVCTSWNDQFIALVSPPPAGSINGNISFDGMLNPVSVNVTFMSVCAGCPKGLAQMQGTGFNNLNDAGATSWVRSEAPIGGSEVFTIRFAIWDAGDTSYDSTVLIDNFQWITSDAVTVKTEPVAMPN